MADYKAYTTKFDVEIRADRLDSVLGPLGRNANAVEQAWHELQSGLLAWRTRLHISSVEAASRIRAALTEEEREQTVVTLLFDQSGSMRGQKMLFAAATADVVHEFLLTLGISCEVLGFTTVKWRGGRSRRRWFWRLWSRNPGRLNDILHVIYQSADERRASTGRREFRQMLRPDLPKENIDGEAILWAAGRLSALPARRKHLIVLSDGAPVDDSTLHENGPAYLADHLEHVVNNLKNGSDIRIAAMGIGYQAQSFYPVSSYVEAPDELGNATISLLEKVLTEPDPLGRKRNA
jgi:cobaltochelatase CobT